MSPSSSQVPDPVQQTMTAFEDRDFTEEVEKEDLAQRQPSADLKAVSQETELLSLTLSLQNCEKTNSYC